MKILLAGGGTLGPVTPLLALVEAWRKRDPSVAFVLVGTSHGPERLLAKQYHIPFYSLPRVRFSRFVSLEWLWLPFCAVSAVVCAVLVLWRQRPNIIIGAGGFTQVPVILVGRLFGIPAFILQTDVHPLLSNRLVAGFVERIFVGWNQTRDKFPKKKTEVVGVPVRESLLQGSRDRAGQRFRLDPGKQTLLVFGGGTGSRWINERLSEIADQIKQEMNVLWITGRGKYPQMFGDSQDHFVVIGEEFEDMYAAADVVVARAGLGTISELSALGKPAILIPLPGYGQQENASVVAHAGAARVLNQEELNAPKLLHEIRSLINDLQRREHYRTKIREILPTNVAEKIIHLIYDASHNI